MKQNDFELRILVGGKPIHEYEHMGNHFVEGRKGSEFELEFRNHTTKRVLAVPSVDGLSVMDGQPATPDSMGYLVPAQGVVRIPGWRLDAANIAKFIFEDKERSYVRTANTQSHARAGVVGMLVYEEKVQVATIPTPYFPSYPYIGTPHCPGIVTQPWQPFWNNAGTAVPKSPFDVRYNTAVGHISTTMGMASDSAEAGTFNMASTESVATASAMAAPAAEAKGGGKLTSRRVQLNEQSPFEIGAGFGQKADFKTTEVKFDRGDAVATIVIFYDSRRNLEKRGIQVLRTQRTYLEDLPQAFNSAGCKPPADWNG